MSELETYVLARAELWMAIANGVDLGLNPPRGMQDHETDGYFHALLYVATREDVWPWVRHLGEPVSTDYRSEPLTEPEVHDYPESGKRHIRARALIADNREVTVTYAEDMPEPVEPDGSPS